MKVLANSQAIRKRQAILLAAHMIVEGHVPVGTIKFMTRVYPLFLQSDHVSATAMAQKCKMSVVAAAKHVNVLTNSGYLNRVNYRAWSLNTQHLENLNSREL